MAGCNRAKSDYMQRALYESYINRNDVKGCCVFISHKDKDMDTAEEIAAYLMKNDIDVYLDKNDTGLQKAVKEGDSKAIVEQIQKALSVSTHILVLISNQTQYSWWVPYEIGYAKKAGKEIASLLTENKTLIPDYLKIEYMIRNAYELKKYAEKIKPYGLLFESVTDVPTQLYQSIKQMK